MERNSKNTTTTAAAATAATVGLLSAIAAALVSAAVTQRITRQRLEKERRIILNQKYERERRARREKLIAAAAADHRANAAEEPFADGTLLPNVRLNRVYLLECEDLRELFPSSNTVNIMKCATNITGGGDAPPLSAQSPLLRSSSFNNLSSSAAGSSTVAPHRRRHRRNSTTKRHTTYNKLMSDHDCILSDIVRKESDPGKDYTSAYLRAGPRELLHFDPTHRNFNAAVVTCGGLCPGLNNVIRGIVQTLHQLYGISGTVYGIQGGFKGFHDYSAGEHTQPLALTPDLVENIHHQGGTVLGSSRGGFDLDKILDFINNRKISQLYVIGGEYVFLVLLFVMFIC